MYCTKATHRRTKIQQHIVTKGFIMKNVKLISAALLLAAASGAAFAGELDGKSDNAWLQQTAISQQAPAPVAAAAPKQESRVTDQSSQAVTP